MKRLANKEDFEKVFSIYMHQDVHPFLGYDPMPTSEFIPIFDELLSSKNFFIYEIDGKVTGFFKLARYSGRCQHVAYIGSLAIDASYQGKGLAMKIMNELIEEQFNNGVKRIELIVESDNPKAIRFYEKLGFKIEGTLKNFYKRQSEDKYIDDHIMALLV